MSQGELAGGPAFLVDILCRQNLLQKADLVVGIEDRKIAFQIHQLRMASDDFGADRMECAEPGHALGDATDQIADPGFHFSCGLVGERDCKDLARVGPPGGEDMGDPRCEDAGLAGAGACQNQ